MNTGRMLISALLVFSIATGAFALERDANMIDTLYLESSSFEYGDLLSLNLSVENVTAVKNESWAIIAGLGFGNVDYDNLLDDEGFFWGSLGVKYYLTRMTTIAAMGSYTKMGYTTSDVEISAGTLEVTQRLLPVSIAVSPFAKVSAKIQEVDHPAGFLSLSTLGEFTELVLKGTVGCDFLMNDTMAFVFSLSYSESEDIDSDGGDTSDGLSAVIAMKYYWE